MRLTLPTIVISQFFCTSVWFAGNSVLPDLVQQGALDPSFVAHLTSSIQFGFITGTLIFAILTISDRFSPSRVFFISAWLAALCNIGMTLDSIDTLELLFVRFLTGFFLAGIYPVGMKIAADYYQTGLGKSLGFLVGALVLGTAFPHFIRTVTAALPWKTVIYATSTLSVLGGTAIFLFVPDGPYRKPGQPWKLATFLHGFRRRNFRAISMGYFGHMWELYAFWAFLPAMLTNYYERFPHTPGHISLLSFLIIASGSLSCAVSGWLAEKVGAPKVAAGALTLSGLCCLASPFLLTQPSFPLLLVFLFFWGMTVIADSPLFSTLVAQNAPEASRGTSLTIVNCLGFATTIVSIQCLRWATEYLPGPEVYLLLALGPLLGLLAFRQFRGTNS